MLELQSIIDAMNELKIQLYTIEEIKNEVTELYFIKKGLDSRRKNLILESKVTVYRDFEDNGNPMRGSSTANLYSSMSYEEVKSTLSDAYFAASFVKNPYYELPSGSQKNVMPSGDKIFTQSTEDNALQTAEAIFTEDISEEVFLNTVEIFASSSLIHLVNSEGIDVTYQTSKISGEFVAQAPKPIDVETYHNFTYYDLNYDSLRQEVKDTLALTLVRTKAKNPPATGTYNVILCNDQVHTLLSYFMDRSCAAYIYPGYSNYKVGTKVQGDQIQGDKITMNLKVNTPYSNEGIPLETQPLITEGTVNTLFGSARFSYYLGIKPIGNYDAFTVRTGSKNMDELMKGSYLKVMNFSDFQMDSVTGDFCGEIRLGYLSDGTSVTPVTGGSISGNIANFKDNLTFSKEKQIHANFEGPMAVLLKDVTVAGC